MYIDRDSFKYRSVFNSLYKPSDWNLAYSERSQRLRVLSFADIRHRGKPSRLDTHTGKSPDLDWDPDCVSRNIPLLDARRRGSEKAGWNHLDVAGKIYAHSEGRGQWEWVAIACSTDNVETSTVDAIHEHERGVIIGKRSFFISLRHSRSCFLRTAHSKSCTTTMGSMLPRRGLGNPSANFDRFKDGVGYDGMASRQGSGGRLGGGDVVTMPEQIEGPATVMMGSVHLAHQPPSGCFAAPTIDIMPVYASQEILLPSH